MELVSRGSFLTALDDVPLRSGHVFRDLIAVIQACRSCKGFGARFMKPERSYPFHQQWEGPPIRENVLPLFFREGMLARGVV
jgi:hypothetical protein